MDTRTYLTIDREALGWPEGPWSAECDKRQWPDAATGYPCLAVRHPERGFWCGYVGVPPEHPLYGADRDCVPLHAHGGVNFAGFCDPNAEETTGICHVPGPQEEPHVYWFGFDCYRGRDLAPGDLAAKPHHWPSFLPELDLSPSPACDANRIQWQVCAPSVRYKTYRTLEYVEEQCRLLALQLAALASAR